MVSMNQQKIGEFMMAESKIVKYREAREAASNYERQYHGCSQATLLALQEALGLEEESVFKSASSLSGGLALMGKTCGALIAGVMVLGMKYGRAHFEEGLGSLLKGCLPAYRLVKWFEGEFGTTVCHEISGLEMDEGTLNRAIQDPVAFEEGLDPELIENASQLCGKVAQKVIEMITEIESKGWNVMY